MTMRRTPRSYDEVRPLYEEAVFKGNRIRQATIELDNLIDSVQQTLIHAPGDSDVIQALKLLDAASTETIRTAPLDLSASFTDVSRMLATSAFTNERAMMPILFGANTRRAQAIRQELANGTEGKSIEIIETLLCSALSPLAKDKRPDDIDHLRGAIQENTVAALFNHYQDGQLIALPSSLKDDVLHGVDLDAYYVAENGQSYKTPISIKSSRDAALREKERYPHSVVVAAADFDNSDLDISRLLVRQDKGAPGLNEDEAAKLDTARHSLYQLFYDQLANGAQAVQLPRHPAQWTVSKFERIA